MPVYDRGELSRRAQKLGFVRDTFEKVLRLTEILKFINENEFLKKHLILKGGTAINMTIFNLPRLSVDIDMDFTPNYSLEDMIKTRGTITAAIKIYMEGEGYQLSNISKFRHSLDSFVYHYKNAGGNRDSIKLEFNYSLRAHIFSSVERVITAEAFNSNFKVRTLNPIELFAAKTNALMNRAAARDLYDFNNMMYYGLFDETEYRMLRKSIIFYASISAERINKTFDTSSIDQLTFTKIKRDLFPVLRKKDNFDLDNRKAAAKSFIKNLMVLEPDEKRYLEAFESKYYQPEYLFDDKKILSRIQKHPMALWKMENGPFYI